jgi:2-C-methyl-D-erythritol 4-phosphate cytidylyltransferase
MISAVIVAGGSGRRMQAAVKKQYLRLGGIPILGHTLSAFDRIPEIDRIILVVPPADLSYCELQIAAPLKLAHQLRFVAAGASRQQSVRNGLAEAGAAEGIVLIHDGVRPFVRQSLVQACLAGVKATGACIPAVAVTDTLKKVGSEMVITETVDRQTLWLAQTPQTFNTALIRQAHEAAAERGFRATDDASVVEFLGRAVCVVPGDPDNIKITHPRDLSTAESILARWRKEKIV